MLDDPPPRNQDVPSGATHLVIRPGNTDGTLRGNAAADFKLLKADIDWRWFKIGGDWNQLRVEANSGKLIVMLNGKRIVGLSDFPQLSGPIGILPYGTGMQYRNIRIKEDLIDQRFHSSEKRLARALLLLARHGQQDRPQGGISKISQETLADMIGATRSRAPSNRNTCGNRSLTCWVSR